MKAEKKLTPDLIDKLKLHRKIEQLKLSKHLKVCKRLQGIGISPQRCEAMAPSMAQRRQHSECQSDGIVYVYIYIISAFMYS